jgi:hypothetical protein
MALGVLHVAFSLPRRFILADSGKINCYPICFSKVFIGPVLIGSIDRCEVSAAALKDFGSNRVMNFFVMGGFFVPFHHEFFIFLCY